MGAFSLHIRLFGTLELNSGDAPSQPSSQGDENLVGVELLPSAPSSPTAQSLLAYLIVHHNRGIPRDRLLGLFWPERSDGRARRALSDTLWRIRQALGPASDRLMTERHTVAFDLQADDWLDVEAFEEQARESVEDSRVDDASVANLQDAAALYRADLLQGIYDDWALVERERLRELYLRLLGRLITEHNQRGDYERALVCAQQLVTADPLREAAHRELMRLYHLLGRPRAALEQFTKLSNLLAEELGVSPAPTTVALRQEIAAALEEFGSPYLPVASPPPPLLSALTHLPFVGRTKERRGLIAGLQAATRGHGGVALVEGEAGVGKTRLINEVVAGARWRGFHVALSKADSLVAAAPYQLLCGALLPLLTPLHTAQLAQFVDPLWLAVTAPILPPIAEHLSHLPAVPSRAPDEEQQRLYQGLAQCVIGMASVAPLLLVLEDLHWADETTLQVLPTLASGTSAGRVLIVLTCRTAEARARRVVWKALDLLDQALPIMRLRVSPFDRSEVVSLVQRALGTDETDADAIKLGRRLQDSTGGNALFLVESLESLLEQGALGQAEGGWCFPSEDLPLPTPASLRELIGSRLTRLPPAVRGVLEHVAVLSEDAEFPVLSQVIDTEPTGLADQLRMLDQRGFLAETHTGYRFQHDVIRDVVYQAIPFNRRKVLHRGAGEALEALRPDRVESLAHHFARGEVWTKAVHWYRRAGEGAKLIYAGGQAAEYYGQGLEAWRRLPSPDEVLGVRLYRERGRIYQDRGLFDPAEKDFRVAHDLAEHVGDRASQARILNHLSYLGFQRGDFEKAVRVARQALSVGVDVGHESEIATALFNQANALRNLGEYREAISLYEEAAAIFERLDDERPLADCLNRMGAALNHVGDFVGGRERIERSLAVRRRLNDKVGISYSLINLAMNSAYLGRFDAMREAAQEALEIATETGDLYGQDAALHDLGVAALEQGLAAEAVPFFQRALNVAREIGDRALDPEVLAEMGRAHQQLGDLDRAGELLEQALGLASISIEQNYVPQLHAFLALFYLAMGEGDSAQKHARTSVEEADAYADPWASALAHRVMGQVIDHLRPDCIGSEPGVHFQRSIAIQRRIDARAELARSLAAYGLYLKHSPRDIQGSASLLEEARMLFRELGMSADLARLEGESGDGLSDRITIPLPHIAAPTGRPLREDEYVEVTWTVVAPEDDGVSGEAGRRRGRILRLLREAGDQSAVPTVEHLAEALGVSGRTIKRDLAALRAQGHDVRTRGSRS